MVKVEVGKLLQVRPGLAETVLGLMHILDEQSPDLPT